MKSVVLLFLFAATATAKADCFKFGTNDCPTTPPSLGGGGFQYGDPNGEIPPMTAAPDCQALSIHAGDQVLVIKTDHGLFLQMTSNGVVSQCELQQ